MIILLYHMIIYIILNHIIFLFCFAQVRDGGGAAGRVPPRVRAGAGRAAGRALQGEALCYIIYNIF